MEWRALIRTELLVPPEPVTKPFFLLKPPFHTAFFNLLSKFVSKICYWLNSCSQTAGLQAWKLLLSLSPGLRPLPPSKYKQSCWNNFYASFIPWAVRNSSITPARNYGHECAEDDSQYSPPALLCMRKNILPFSQQLLQTALAPESPTGVLAESFSHTVFKQDSNRGFGRGFLCTTCYTMFTSQTSSSFEYDTTLLSQPVLVCFFISLTEFNVFLVPG